ncbi:hypothetical protein CEP52_017496 [Fusarium oligoseptatum]|uniref:DNA/RNA-binding domain-containing protein n=1 Tax=Fusarium oligoseptatum TaxID=2604345 RepID=A0A428RQ06_9HYPO|nr:hypothetical protein CEP52_017496 [Fusarium oligoseptatum]
MAIEDHCSRDRETWAGVSRYWYSKASDQSPATGRLYHHLAILARPNALQQLFYYTKSLCGPIPFPGTRESIMTLLSPALIMRPNRLAPIDAEFLRVHAILFSGASKEKLQESTDKFIKQLDSYIGHAAEQWLDAGYHIGISLSCSLLGYGAESNVLMRAISQKPEEIGVAAEANPDEMFKQALSFTVRIIETVMQRWGDTNTLPFLHTMMVFVNHMTRFPAAISLIDGVFPWKQTSLMLNYVLNSLELEYKVRSDFRFPENNQLPRPLPEDFAMRGLIYTEDYYPHGWFDNGNIEGRERYLELGSMTRERKNRLITLGYRIATSGRWLIWNEEARCFTVPKKYDSTVEDPPEPIRDVVEAHLCEAQDGPKPYLERKGHLKIHEAIDELPSCVFGCAYMAMGIELELKGKSDLAASYEAEAEACFEKALRDSSQYAVRVSMPGITLNENVGDEAWSQLEEWLRNYSSWKIDGAFGRSENLARY